MRRKAASSSQGPYQGKRANERGKAPSFPSAGDSLLFFTAFSTTISVMNLFPDIPIDARALYVLSTLEKAGYSAWLVGGCVRDAFMGIEANDYDIATCAPWQETSSFSREPAIASSRRGRSTAR